MFNFWYVQLLICSTFQQGNHGDYLICSTFAIHDWVIAMDPTTRSPLLQPLVSFFEILKKQSSEEHENFARVYAIININ